MDRVRELLADTWSELAKQNNIDQADVVEKKWNEYCKKHHIKKVCAQDLEEDWVVNNSSSLLIEDDQCRYLVPRKLAEKSLVLGQLPPM